MSYWLELGSWGGVEVNQSIKFMTTRSRPLTIQYDQFVLRSLTSLKSFGDIAFIVPATDHLSYFKSLSYILKYFCIKSSRGKQCVKSKLNLSKTFRQAIFYLFKSSCVCDWAPPKPLNRFEWIFFVSTFLPSRMVKIHNSVKKNYLFS